jgi:hypothetical protein
MKLKISLDPNTIKHFFIDHVEKLLFGLVVVCFLLFVYRAVARDTLAWQPQDLVQDSEAAKKKIEATQPSPPAIERYTEKAAKIRKPIAVADYTCEAEWDPLKFGENVPRGLPKLFPIKDLRVRAGSGAFAMASPEEEEDESAGPTATMRGQRWAVLTGLIEHRKQKEAYDTAYQDAAQWDYSRDYPDYVFYRVERAEVDPRVESAELKWAPIHVKNMLALQDFWLQPGAELVDPMFFPPGKGSASMVYPLGPLQNRTWGPEAAHSPEIPMREDASPLMAGPGAMPGMAGMAGAGKKAGKGNAGAVEPEAEEEAPKAPEAAKKVAAERRKKARQKLAAQPDEPDSFDTATGGAGAAGPMGPGAMAYATSGRGGPGRGAMPGAMPGMTSGSMPGMMPGTRAPMRTRAGAGGREEETEEQQEVEYCLFRFFDFTVKPGKHYRYRVKLVLANPNHGMPSHFLENEGMEKTRTLEADWSEPSPPVSVPVDSQVLAVSAKASNGTASLMLVLFDEKDGTSASEEFASVARGQLLNYRERPFADTSPTGMSGPMGMGGMLGGRSPLERSETKVERKVDYLTNALLLDVSGGGGLPGKDRSLVEPGSVLLLNGEGNLVVHNELDDLSDCQFYKPPEVKEVATVRGDRRGTASSNPMEAYMRSGMSGPGGQQKGKGKGKGGSSSGLPPGMTPGMMPGMMPGSGGGMGIGDLDDSGGKRKGAKKSR